MEIIGNKLLRGSCIAIRSIISNVPKSDGYHRESDSIYSHKDWRNCYTSKFSEAFKVRFRKQLRNTIVSEKFNDMTRKKRYIKIFSNRLLL